ADYITAHKIELNLLDQRDLVTALVNGFLGSVPTRAANSSQPMRAANASAPEMAAEAPVSSDPYARNPSRASVDQAKLKLQPMV
ncbi:hypothetical protein, partial [Klebsiella pneumoniae]|uniref:hypothetical protein n=1 Tax=Klebsiella pneumoniae TaxID=573 RepID=UPI003EE18014